MFGGSESDEDSSDNEYYLDRRLELLETIISLSETNESEIREYQEVEFPTRLESLECQLSKLFMSKYSL